MIQTRDYRIPGARFSLLNGVLLVQYRSGTNVTLQLGEGSRQPYLKAGPVWLRIDDGTGKQPVVEADPPPAQDDFGVVLTELAFRGEVTARIEGGMLVVTAAGEPVIVEGADRIPVTAGDLAGAGWITWASDQSEGEPHPPPTK